MTLLIVAAAAVISTVLWYRKAPDNTWRISTLCWLYWGASLMWLVDAFMEYLELHETYFSPAPEDMLNDAFLGLSVTVFGLVIWLVDLLLHDPKHVFRKEMNSINNNVSVPEEIKENG